MKFRTMYKLVLLFVSFQTSIYAQKGLEESSALKDWDDFNHKRMIMYATPEEQARFENRSLLEYSKFVDEVYTKRSKLAEAFLDKHPNSEHYHEALSWYLNVFLIPMFIPDIESGTQLDVLKSFEGTNRYGPEVAPFYRALPIDNQAMNRWLEKGNHLVSAYLDTDAPVANKFKIEQSLLYRDIIQAQRWYKALGNGGSTLEKDYWERFDLVYWETFRWRVEQLIYKYPDLEELGPLVQQFIDFVGSTCKSDSLQKHYWNRFFALSDKRLKQEKSLGITALNTKARETLKAMQETNQFDKDKPISMAFRAMDGRQVNLENLRGKVVLLDFWSMSCAPCIKEMPHLKTMYDKYKNLGFEIIGIAAEGDGAKDIVMNILNKNNATWPQRLDRGKDAIVNYHRYYSIKSLPTVWLLDKQGILVDTNARGEQLEPLIRKYLDLDK